MPAWFSLQSHWFREIATPNKQAAPDGQARVAGRCRYWELVGAVTAAGLYSDAAGAVAVVGVGGTGAEDVAWGAAKS